MSAGHTDPIERIRSVLRCEGEAVLALADQVAPQAEALAAACRMLCQRCGEDRPGRLVVIGVGKAGLVGRKLAATFASTGTPALFLHPTDARHGDLGMVREADLLLVLSNSGASEELVALLPSLARIGAPIIAITGRGGSPLAIHAEVVLAIGAVTEACPLGLAPSTSTTVMLALGDALALAVQELRDFTPEQYARYHPGGALGRRLMTCREAMRAGERIAVVERAAPLREVVRAITAARAGSALVTEADGRLAGIFTDGDLRRLLSTHDDPAAILAGAVETVATIPCRAIHGEELLSKALHDCAEHRIDELPVVDDAGRILGLIDLQDLADRGFEL